MMLGVPVDYMRGDNPFLSGKSTCASPAVVNPQAVLSSLECELHT